MKSMRESITRSFLLLFAIAAIAVAVAYDSHTADVNAMRLGSSQATSSVLSLPDVADPNPLLANWEGPYGGVPPFDRVQVALFKPALETAMTQNLVEVEKIANDRSAPTFEN